VDQIAVVEDHEFAAHDGPAAEQAGELGFTAAHVPSVLHCKPSPQDDELQHATAGSASSTIGLYHIDTPLPARRAQTGTDREVAPEPDIGPGIEDVLKQQA
jgi:hypothetical protein